MRYWLGGFIIFVCQCLSFIVGVVVGYDMKKDDQILLPKTDWVCTVSRLRDVKKETECMAYRHREATFDGLSPRRREHNKEQGAPIHKKQPSVPRWTWGRSIQD